MSKERKNPMVWGLRVATIKQLFSKGERLATNQLINKLRMLLINAGEFGCFIKKAQISDTGLQHNKRGRHEITHHKNK